MSAPAAGICQVCTHHRWVESRRGSSFLLCEKSAEDPRFPKYPSLPVWNCGGFELEAGGERTI